MKLLFQVGILFFCALLFAGQACNEDARLKAVHAACSHVRIRADLCYNAGLDAIFTDKTLLDVIGAACNNKGFAKEEKGSCLPDAVEAVKDSDEFLGRVHARMQKCGRMRTKLLKLESYAYRDCVTQAFETALRNQPINNVVRKTAGIR